MGSFPKFQTHPRTEPFSSEHVSNRGEPRVDHILQIREKRVRFKQNSLHIVMTFLQLVKEAAKIERTKFKAQTLTCYLPSESSVALSASTAKNCLDFFPAQLEVARC